MADFITLAVILLIVGAAIVYIRKEKKKGTVCIGCPDAQHCASAKKGGCGGNCSGCSGCSGGRQE